MTLQLLKLDSVYTNCRMQTTLGPRRSNSAWMLVNMGQVTASQSWFLQQCRYVGAASVHAHTETW